MLMQTHEARLSALREELARRGLDGFVVPISDEHLSEYVGGYAQRLAWLTGFGGSAGTAVVLKDSAAIFVDGRYTLQVRDQVDGRLYECRSVPQDRPAEWIVANAPPAARIGFDPWLHTSGWAAAARKALAATGGELVAVADNPIDAVWQDRPEPSDAPAFLLEERLAGRSSADKLAAIADWLAEQDCDATVIAALDSVAWTLNVRGRDVEHTPVALSYLVAHRDGTADWYIAPGKVPDEVTAALGNAVRIVPRDRFEEGLGALAGKTVALDPDRAVSAIFAALEQAGAKVAKHTDPTVLPKAIKTVAEQAGHRAAQARDGAAVARFLHWLDVTAPGGTVDELGSVAQLLAFRQASADLADTSFDTISGAGPNGAIVHYRASEETNRRLEPGSVFLCDSGGQYPDGTTDITRTVWIDTPEGTEPPAEVKDRFTRVLKGHIALACQTFPAGTPGSALDTLARQHLWAAGVDYAHGTGHGVGSFLGVHEGPQRIAKSRGGQAGTEQELMAGMILSNEPGYYKAGEYGIRIENLVLVEPRAIPGAEGEWLGFETLTLAPIDRRLVARDLLSEAEIGWWNAYHARVREVLAPQLDGEVLDWLEDACAPL
jgi:Xaa-Pro aminopeptidase